MKQPYVWVVGDSMLDLSVHAQNFKRSQEDVTVPVLPDPRRKGMVIGEMHAGGAANVAVNLDALGCRVMLISNIAAEDFAGKTLRESVLPIGRMMLISETEPNLRSTTVKTRYYEGGRLIARVDCDAVGPRLMPNERLGVPDAVVVTDYGKGAVDRDSILAWAAFCAEERIPLYADPKLGRTNLWGALPDVCFVANLEEAVEATAELLIQQGRVSKTAAMRVADKLGTDFKVRIVKCGRYGSALGIGREPAIDIPVVAPKSVYDVQGAGDTYIAALVAARCRGAEWTLAARFASAAAGVAVGIPGTATVTLQDALQALKPYWGSSEPGIFGRLSQDAAYAIVSELRSIGYRVAMTGGCFDLPIPHPGHLRTIKGAAELADFLFVAVDSDERVRQLKGDGRPYTPINDRLEAVSSIRGVSGAFPFDSHPKSIVEKFKPDYWVKGGEYSEYGVPEAENMAEWGGELVLLPMAETKSTTQRLSRIGESS